MPVVTVGNRQAGWPAVRIDDRAAMALATRYMLELGHRHIGYAGTVPASVTHLQTPFDRRQAFLEVLAENGLSCPPEWTLECDWTAQGAYEHAEELFATGDYPTCVVAASDEIAYGVVCAARRRGIDVPRELSVIGIDDHVHAGILDLTTVRQDVEAQGRRAGALMLRALQGEDVGPTHDEVLDVELVVRGTTGPPRATSPTPERRGTTLTRPRMTTRPRVATSRPHAR
jgi:DNA-binding LacI/PurR family transcriptional regulator